MSPSKSVNGPFKSSAWYSRSPEFHAASIPAGFHSQKFWGLLFTALEPWASRAQCGAGTPLSSVGTFAAEISLLIFKCHTWVREQPVPHLHSSYQDFSSAIQAVMNNGLFCCNFDVVVGGSKY